MRTLQQDAHAAAQRRHSSIGRKARHRPYFPANLDAGAILTLPELAVVDA
jgi:hypothetical protein